jgi:two-component system, sensor histidine kinase
VTTNDRSDLILLVAPFGRDAELMCEQLGAAGLRCEACKDIETLCSRLPDGVGAIMVTEEALPQERLHLLVSALEGQPAWSEIPLIILSGAPSLDSKPRSFALLMKRTNVTLIDRPVRIKSLVSAAHTALRARQRQYDIRDLMDQLEERIHERDRFLAVLGHELRNPLGAILLASQMTDDDGKLEGEHAQLIERQSRHLTRLVNDLLDLSRVAAGKITLKRQVVNLDEVADQSLSVVTSAATHHGISLRVARPKEPLLIYADPIRVDQIIGNVLTNAIKYTPEGGHVTLEITRDEDHALIRVTDDGVGIAPERIGGIFEIFAQAENAIGRSQGGMGIGLALVRNLVQLHDGEVSARSDGIGHGSEFVIRLPLATEEQLATVPSNAELTSAAVHASRRIVIIEDNPDVRDLLRLKLTRLGHNVVGASDGNEGLRAVLDSRPDLALIDLGLPGLDGYEVARHVRDELGGDVVLIAVSGFGQPEDKRRALDAGFDEHITKPADVRDIENVLTRFPPRNSASA